MDGWETSERLFIVFNVILLVLTPRGETRQNGRKGNKSRVVDFKMEKVK